MQQAEGRRIILHPGFHKTGTSTVQATLAAGRQTLMPWTQILLKEDLPALCDNAQRYARTPSGAHLAELRKTLVSAVASWDPSDPRSIIISAEDLCGAIPGRAGRVGYPHATELMQLLARALLPLGPVYIYLSTRDRDGWMRSCYGHHLRHSSLALDLDEYVATQSIGADLTGIVGAIAAACPNVTVSSMRLAESAGQPQGPATPLLDMALIPMAARAALHIPPPKNVALPPHIQADLLALNRAHSDKGPRDAAKQKLLSDHRKTRR